MKGPLFGEGSAERYRADYLKLRSVLWDRATGLPAFPVLFDRLRALLDDRRALGVLHLEAEDLSGVESLYGWQVFDRIVTRAAAVLREAVGAELPAGTLLAVNAVAGDRFLAFVPEDAEGNEPDSAALAAIAAAVADRLDRAFDADDFAGLNPRLCFRAGYARLALDPFYRFERVVHGAVERARALPERRERRRERSWGEELSGIIREQAVRIVFQPVIDLRDRALLGYEALARGPRDSMFETPRAMFALSSRVGVARELDRICAEAALRTFAGAVLEGKLFVNVLGDSLRDDEWRTRRLPALLQELALDPAGVVLEVSERGAALDPDGFVAGLGRAQHEGVHLALDDVGTGGASQAAIESIRPDYVKIDPSLVRGVHENLVKQDVLQTVVRLAERIGAAVIAEGVESEAEASVLAVAGAGFGQGFLFGMPAAGPWPSTGRARLAS